MKKKYIFIISIVILIIALLIAGMVNKKNSIEDNNFKIVTSFYPIYIMTLNITNGANQVSVENMTNEQIGCIHNYTLKSNDLMKLENANVFIESGLGIESFSDKILNTYNDIRIINSSEYGISAISDEEETNPHIWVSTANYIVQVKNIANELAKLDVDNAELYLNNANQYIEKINKTVETLKLSKKINAITFNETLSYLEDENLKITTIETGHEETTVSAQTLSEVIEQIKLEGINVILVDANESSKIAEAVSKETGAKMYYIDSYLNGDKNKDSYLEALKENIQILNEIGVGE